MEQNTSRTARATLPIPQVLVLLLFLGLTFTIVIAVTSCSSVRRTSWELTDRPSGDQLQIGVQVGGCDVFARTSVIETDDRVLVEAYVRDDVFNECDSIINIERRTVQLQAPLEDRTLQGCNPPSALYGRTQLSDTDCAASVR